MSDVARELGCLPETINSIALCRAPRTEPPHFQDDIETVAEKFQLRPNSLMRIIRYAQVAPEIPTLLAARDYDEEENKAEENNNDGEDDE